MVDLPAADKAALATMMQDGGSVWAQALDKRGKPGTQVLNAYTAALRGAK